MDDLCARLEAALSQSYAIERELGRGGMAIVYLARDVKHERLVALKVLRPELSATLGPERFHREIKLAARLKHPYILKLHDSGDVDGLLYYVMPYVEGESLRQRLAREPRLPVADALRIVREAADALDYAHKQGVVHRDIKPENILFEEAHAIVSDFGIARAISTAEGPRVTGTGLVVGTPDYMSPEQARGRGAIDGRTDIYSLGLVLYEMLTGELAGLDADGMLTTLERLRPEVPPAVGRAVRRALAPEPSDRFATAGAFALALSGATQESRWAPALRRRWWVVPGAAAMIAGGLLIGSGAGESSPTATLDLTQIAVLYFDDLSAGEVLGHVAAGLTEDLIAELGQVAALRVISPEGVRPYRHTSLAPDSIARVFGVGTLIAGSVARSGDDLRVAVRLIDGARGDQLHAQTFVRPFRELFALQDSLTDDVANALRGRLGEEVELRARRSSARNVAAWELVRRGDGLREEARALARDGELPTALRALGRAESLYALAEGLDARWTVPVVLRGQVALTMADLADDRPAGRPPTKTAAEHPIYGPDWLEVGFRHAGRALILRPEDPQALALRGTLRYVRWERSYLTDPESLAAGERDLRAAVTSDPTLARAWFRLSDLFRLTGRFPEADQAARRALAADAYLREARAVIASLFYIALHRERFDDARAWCATGRRRFPDNPDFRECELRLLGWSARGRSAVARAWDLIDESEHAGSERGSSLWADRRLLVAAILARTGLRDSARGLMASVHSAMRGDTTAAWFAMAEAHNHVLLGERDAALRRLRVALAGGSKVRGYVAAIPWFRALRGDPAFDSLASVSP